MCGEWDSDDYDFEADLQANEARLARECDLRATLERAEDRGHTRLAEAARQLLEVITE